MDEWDIAMEIEENATEPNSLMHRIAEEKKQNFKSGFIDRVRGLVNGEGKKVLLVKEQYLVDQFVRLGQEFLLETQSYIIVVKDFDDIKELDEKMMEECGWVRKETKPKIHLL